MLITRLFSRFMRGERGTVAITYALSAVPMLLAVGASIDMVRYGHSLTALQSALDSAALSVAAGKGTEADRQAQGQAAFTANVATSELPKYKVAATFKIDGAAVIAEAKGVMPTAFMQLAGIKSMDLVVDTEIAMPESKKAEIALVLDYSGSMEDAIGGGVKYIGMRDAAKKLVEDLEKSAPDKVKIGLVPFSHHVYTTLPKSYVLGQSGGGNWTGCTQDRAYPFNVSDGTPDSRNETKWGQPQAPVHASWGCDGYIKGKLRVRPLSNDFAGIKSQLDAMTPYAWTHIALGVEFGLHVLSPGEPYGGSAAFTDEGTQKVMVVLTDGMQTEPAFGPGGVRSVSQGERNLEELCAVAKGKKIRMMTIAYDLDDTSTRARLRDCATDPAKDFFVANDTSGVANAFDEIRRVVTAQIFISK
jgi:Flp pilus assembly protein TadG